MLQIGKIFRNQSYIFQGTMGLLPDTQNCGLCMRREYRERFTTSQRSRHASQHVRDARAVSGSLTRYGGENVPGIPGACATRNFVYLVRGP